MKINCLISVPGLETNCIQLNGSPFNESSCIMIDSGDKTRSFINTRVFYNLIDDIYPFGKFRSSNGRRCYYIVVDDKVVSEDGNYEFNNGMDYYINSINCDDILEYGNSFIHLNVLFRMLGGKGGFGAMMKSQGAKKKQSTNLDSCRNLSGQRVRTVRLNEQVKQWQERSTKDVEILKLPKKELLKDEPQDNIHVKDVKKDIKKVKYSVLRGIDELKNKEADKLEKKIKEDKLRESMLENILDVYDL